MDVSQENDETSTPVLQIPRQPLAEEDLQIISDQATVNGVFPPPFNTDISEKSTKTSRHFVKEYITAQQVYSASQMTSFVFEKPNITIPCETNFNAPEVNIEVLSPSSPSSDDEIEEDATDAKIPDTDTNLTKVRAANRAPLSMSPNVLKRLKMLGIKNKEMAIFVELQMASGKPRVDRTESYPNTATETSGIAR